MAAGPSLGREQGLETRGGGSLASRRSPGVPLPAEGPCAPAAAASLPARRPWQQAKPPWRQRGLAARPGPGSKAQAALCRAAAPGTVPYCGAMAAEVVVVGSCMTDLVRLVPGVAPAGRQAPAWGLFRALTGRKGPEVKRVEGISVTGAGQWLPAPAEGRVGRNPPHPSCAGSGNAGVSSVSRPGLEKGDRRQVRWRRALGSGNRGEELAAVVRMMSALQIIL